MILNYLNIPPKLLVNKRLKHIIILKKIPS